METITVEVKRSTFPFNTKTYIKVGDLPAFPLNSGELKELSLPSEGTYNVEVKSSWIRVSKSVLLTKATPVLHINFVLPDGYFIFSAFVIIPLAILSLIGAIKPFISGIATLIFFTPIIFYTFLASKKYFVIRSSGKV